MRWLNYQHLFYFWNVVRYGGVTKASHHLRLAQPTISAQLKAFEDVLGEKLLDREGRGLALTDTGQIAYRYAEQIFSLGTEFLEVLDGGSITIPKDFKIGIADVVPKSLAYKLIKPAFKHNSAVMISCIEDKTERLLADLSIGEIDLVVADRPIPPNVKVKAFNHFVGECGLAFLASKDLTKRFKKGFPNSLDKAPLLIPTAESAVRQELDQWFDQKEVHPQIVAAFQDRALMKIAAREGQGIIPVPEVIAADVCSEYHLELIGGTTEVKERLYLISIERRLKNPMLVEICEQGQKNIFK